ncbi:lipoprotein LipL21 [Leptospira saintgironsiae]|uniref:Lipoprotein LipL21 n=1 Tax=Leptospira saintgironsiae TaxID=2023183 RepID=A0A2M9YHW9_9LEPT|nr:lipoprotein LipL21 [Leptospira saintgironsiae]PJZ51145.1 lipoprotein LipL21 [Leptospira saintgironsiae]
MIKKVIVTAVSVVLLTYCGANTAIKKTTSVTSGPWSFEGWGGPPEQRNDGKTPKDTNPKEYYYTKISSHASIKSIAKKNPVMIQSTCRESARLEGTSDLIKKMYDGFQPTGWFSSNKSQQELTTDCNPTLSASLVQNIKIYECKATGPGSDPNDISQDNWEECLCIIYVKFPGGRDALIEKVK